jgi:nicotinamide phosphoribosyltransferase
LVACVSDSYDIRNAVSHIWGEQLRDKVMQRQGTLVIRPDSGNPIEVLRDVFCALEEKFGLDNEATARKGWKVLSPCVRVIQGDGVNYHTIQNMVSILTREGWSMDNFAFGMGGALLQQLNRDTQKFAIKCSAIRVNGVWRDVYKRPASDPTKNSKRGNLALVNSGGNIDDYQTVQIPYDQETTFGDELVTVFENGSVLFDESLETIRKRISSADTFEAEAEAERIK